MKMKMMKKVFFISLLFLSLVSFGQNKHLFDQGKEAYKNGKYQQAINSWMQILDKGEASAELYFNIGNAQYKLNHIGPSIYYYEKALMLSPNDSDIKTNLAFAENARIDAIEPLPQSVFSKWYNGISGIFTFNVWAIWAVVFSIVFVIFFLFYYFSYKVKTKRFLFLFSSIALFLIVVTVTMAFLTYNDYVNDKAAIIFSSQIEVKSEPSMGSASAFVLHEGTKVQITGQDGNWFRISLADGKDGWVPASDIKQL